MLTPAQIRAARAMLGWSARVLAKSAGVHLTTVQRLERSTEIPRGTAASLSKIERALQAGGVEFIERGHQGTGPGVMLRDAETVSSGEPFRVR